MNVTILGTGNIAHKIASTILQMNDVRLYSVISRTSQKAEAFAKEFHIPHYSSDYTQLRKDRNIDLVYIATPHSEHYHLTKFCLLNHKNVLCEKPLAINTAQALELFQLSQKNQCLLAEAIWTRYMPSRFLLTELLTEGLIGSVSSFTANLGYDLQHIPRMTSLKTAGGALLDLAVYPLHFANMFFDGMIQEINAIALKDPQGIDLKNSISITYESGIMATLTSDMTAFTDRRGVISGKKGDLVVDPINNCQTITHFNPSHQRINTYYAPSQITGYEYELLACKKAIENNWIQCPEALHKDTLQVLQTLDKVRSILHITFPCE